MAFKSCPRLRSHHQEIQIYRDWYASESEEAEFGEAIPPCYHEVNADMLMFLQKRASAEIKHGVMVTIRTRLPTELTETILEYAMLAEGYPLDPMVWEERKL
jgi:hypothetical protein